MEIRVKTFIGSFKTALSSDSFGGRKKAMIFNSTRSTNPWVYFVIFLMVDAYLSYVPADNWEKYFIFLIGILVPIFINIFLKSSITKTGENIFRQEQFQKSAFGLWILL